MQRQLRWVGYVIRMQSNRLPASHYALHIQNYSMESTPVEVRRNVSRIMSTQPCGSAQFRLMSWRHWRPTEKRGGTCVRRAYRAAFDVNYDQEAEARRARRHTVTRAPASARPRCIAHLYVAESAHPSWGCGVIAAVIGHHC